MPVSGADPKPELPLPSGPSAPASVQTLAFARDPVGALLSARAAYGPLFTLRFAGVGPVVAIADVDAAVRLMDADPQAARAGEARRRILPQASPRSSFGADADRHRAARGRIESAFAPARIERLDGGIRRLAEAHVDHWPMGRPFRMLPRMRTLTQDVFVRLMLGVRDEARAAALVAAMRRLLWTPGNPPLTPPDRDEPGGPLVDTVFRRRLRPVAQLLDEEVRARRGNGTPGDTILDLMVASQPRLSGEEAVDELLVVMAAAQEPPSIALAWLVERLARHPEVAEAFVKAGPGDPVRQAIIDETLRLRPPAMASLRRLTAPFDANGVELPAGTMTMAPIPLLHRDPESFPDAEEFRPARFDGNLNRPEAFRPFGGGARRCIAEPLARAEMHAAIGVVFNRLRVRALWPRPERPVQRATVLVPHRSVPVLTGARLPASPEPAR